MQIICFEDQFVDRLRPITLARPAYAISCASLTLADWLTQLPGTLSIDVRPHLSAMEKLDRGVAAPSSASDKDGVLLVNARLVPEVKLLEQLQQMAKADQSSVVMDPEDNVVLLARVTAADIASQQSAIDQADGVAAGLIEIAATLPKATTAPSAFRYPHEVIAHHMALMPEAMQWRLKHGDYTETSDGVFAAEGATLGKYSVVDSSEGPILLDKNVSVGPFCFLSGPVYAGPGARVIEHAALKDGVALGHTTKIGGEVEASVVEPFTNKQHHGFLGHSYLGSWINLGAGTCNSDLKNTYGKINMSYGEKKVTTGMQFLGCVIGDYSKTAINTSIFTGKVIGVCSMLYGFATENVPSYVNYARLFGQTSLLPADVMINTQQRMFARRKVQQRECDKQLIRDMYKLTHDERADSVEQDEL
ncbi:MAG: putative sugar nucleotidyl transferase [Pirellulaceae bacterium]